MILFVRDVPRNLSRKELKNGVQQALQPRIRLPFQAVPTAVNARFLVIHDKDTGGTERHGLVMVDGGRKDDSVLKKFRRVQLKGQFCTVRPYVKRSSQQDRQSSVRPVDFNLETSDRRRSNIEAEIERKPYIKQ